MHLVVGTPMYGGLCCSEYTKSLLQLQSHLEGNGHRLTTIFVGNESLVPRARNKIARLFLENTLDASHLLFMDADQEFTVGAVMKMLSEDKDIIAGPVPMKGIAWDRVRRAIEKGVVELESMTGIFNVVPLEGEEIGSDPFRVKYAGSGFMLIRRSAFDKTKPRVETYSDRGEHTYNFFTQAVHEGELLSEDFNFCRLYGGDIWLAPYASAGHFGAYRFRGNFMAALQLEAMDAGQ